MRKSQLPAPHTGVIEIRGFKCFCPVAILAFPCGWPGVHGRSLLKLGKVRVKMASLALANFDRLRGSGRQSHRGSNAPCSQRFCVALVAIRALRCGMLALAPKSGFGVIEGHILPAASCVAPGAFVGVLVDIEFPEVNSLVAGFAVLCITFGRMQGYAAFGFHQGRRLLSVRGTNE